MRNAASGFTKTCIKAKPAPPSTIPKIAAFSGSTCPDGTGRTRVRTMIWSMSRSKYMLRALAPPATTEPPKTVASISQAEGMPPSASIIAGIVVMTSSMTIRGFVSRMYDQITPRMSRAAVAVVVVIVAKVRRFPSSDEGRSGRPTPS